MELPAPSVTLADVEAAIKHESYTVLPNGRTTVCQLTLDNGFTVEGQSACVSLANFNAERGNTIARANALNEVWQLLGFRLADRLALLKPIVPVVEEAAPATVGAVGPIKPVELGDQVRFFEQVGDQESVAMVGFVSAVLDHQFVGLTILAPNGTVHSRDKVLLVYPWMERPAVPYYARPRH